jgi:hypothetical protein
MTARTVQEVLGEGARAETYLTRETLRQAREVQAAGGVPPAALHFLRHAAEWTFTEFCLRLGVPTETRKQASRARRFYSTFQQQADWLFRLEPAPLAALFTAEEEQAPIPRCGRCQCAAVGLCLDCEAVSGPQLVAGNAGFFDPLGPAAQRAT